MAKKPETIADGLIKEMPDVQEHVAALEDETAAQQAAEQETANRVLDRDGFPFDPARHETGPNGAPVLNKDGTIRMKRGMGAPRSRLAEPRSKPSGPAGSDPLSAPGTTPTDVGRQIAESIFAMGQLIGGEEWAPVYNDELGINEREQMQSAWAAYCEAKGMGDLPPGMVLVIAIGGYVVPRLTMPKTKTRMQRAKEWAIKAYLNFKHGKSGNAAQSHSGDNRKRKDDTGETTSKAVSG